MVNLCPRQRLNEIVDALHPATFRGLPAEKVSAEQVKRKLEEKAEVPERQLGFFAELIESCCVHERSVLEELFKYGNSREQIIKTLNQELEKYENWEEWYEDFLEKQVKESQNPLRDNGRGPYRTIGDADKDFLRRYQ